MSEAIPYSHDKIENLQAKNEAGYQPSAEESKAIKLVDDLYGKAKKARSARDGKWLDYYRMFRGRQWKDQAPSYRNREVINLIFTAIQGSVPILTDTRPKPEFIPTEPGDLELAQILNDVFDSDWSDGNWLYKLTEIIYDAHFYGVGMGSQDYDPEASLGAGRIVFESEDPFCAYPDPHARNVNEKANYFVWAEPTPIEKLKREYPKVARFIKPDLLDLSRYDRENFDEDIRYRQAGDSRTFTEGKASYNIDSRDEALKVTLYIHDLEYIEEEVQSLGEQGQEEITYVQKLKYPRGRKICIASGVLLEDGPIPYDDKKFPYLRLTNYIVPHEFWGISEIEQLESPQKIFNKLVSFALDVQTLMGNPIWIVPQDSGVDTDNLFNRPGLVVEPTSAESAAGVRRESGVQLQPYVLQMIDMLKMWFDDISGYTQASRGVRPEGVTAAAAIEALQESSQTRLRQKTRNIDAFLQDMGKMYVSRVFQYYDTPRIFRVTGNDNVTKYFKFHVDKVPVVDPMTGAPTGEVQSVAKIRTFQLGDDGRYHESEEKAYQVRGEFDVRVSSGSGLPFEKNRIESQSYNLFDRGIIDAEEVLRNIKYTNAEAVLKRMAEKAAMQAQAEAQGQMAQAAPAS